MLRLIKEYGPLAVGELAKHLRITREAARQQLKFLEQECWITRTVERPKKRSGRPSILFTLTSAGDYLFPKRYDALSLTLVDAVAQQLGPEAFKKLLTALTDQQVQQWEPKLAGNSVVEKIRAIKGIYFESIHIFRWKRIAAAICWWNTIAHISVLRCSVPSFAA